MGRGSDEIERALRVGGGVLARREDRALSGSIDWALRCGRLETVLPGVYARPADRDDFRVRVRALAAWDRDAVLTGAAAARFTFWPELVAPVVEASARSDLTRRGFRIRRRRIRPELIAEIRGVRCSSPALTALELTNTYGGNAIDTVLRTRAATLDQLHEALALTPSRAGNQDRRELLLDSRDEPWSEAERGLHRLLREAGITGWRGNYG